MLEGVCACALDVPTTRGDAVGCAVVDGDCEVGARDGLDGAADNGVSVARCGVDGDTLGCLEGLTVGAGVGGVGEGVPHAVLPQLHAALLHSGKHALVLSMMGAHPGAQSRACTHVAAGLTATPAPHDARPT